MILVDANILFYAAGREHAHREASVMLLERVALREIDAALDAEVLQEVLHRYRLMKRWQEGAAIYDSARRVFSKVLPITVEVTDRARILMGRVPNLVARDAIHAAVVQVYGLEAICSFDRDFDRIIGLKRIEP